MSQYRPKIVLVLLTAIAVVLGLASVAQAAPRSTDPVAGTTTTADPAVGGDSPARPADSAGAKARARAMNVGQPDVPTSVTEGARDRASTTTIVDATPKQRVIQPAAIAAADSTLSGLSLAGRSFGGMAPGFAPSVRDYEAVIWDDATVAVTPTPADGAQAVVSEAGTTYDLTDGTATVPVSMGRNDIQVTVTAADNSTTTYRVHLWSVAAPASKIVSVADARSSKLGGGIMSVVLSDGALPPNCGRMYWVDGQPSWPRNSTYDASTNLATDEAILPQLPDRATGTFDLQVQTNCNVYNGNGWMYFGSSYSTASRTAAVKYVDSFTIDNVTVPSVVTSGSRFVATGRDFSAYSDLRYWLSDSQGNIETDLWWWNPTGNGSVDFILDYPWGEDFFKGPAGPRTLHIGYCPINRWQVDAECTSVYAKTVNWVPPTPSNVSFSPANGPVAGGTLVKMKGRFLASGINDLHVFVGGREVDGLQITRRGAWEANTYDDYATWPDLLEFRTPAGLAPGTYPVTVTTEIGTGIARGSFTLSARPTIDTISPATVANTGGAVITVTGSNFGTAGTPTVIVNGTKAPFVKRANAGKLLAVVPAQTDTTGPVDVSVGSPQGGGVSDPARLQLAAPGTAPAVTAITPSSAHSDDTVTLTGTNFATTGTAVSVDGNWVLPDSVTSTSISFTVPGTDTAGAKDVVVATPTGRVTKAGGLTVLADAGISVVTPNSLPSYATGAASKITIDGAGFGSSGTVKVGTAAAVSYTASAGGTHIANVSVPTSAAGLLPIVVTPAGSTTPLRGTVTVTGPGLNYVGSDPFAYRYADIDANDWRTLGHVIEAPLGGGTPMLLKGTGFGPSGQLTVGGSAVATTSWSDTAITFKAPAHAAGAVAIVVKPAGSTLTATRTNGITYSVPPAAAPTLAKVETVADNQRPRNYFDPVGDLDNRVTVTGAALTGSVAANTRVTLAAGSETATVVPNSVTATAVTFAAPRNLQGGWKNVTVTTDVGSIQVGYGLYYMAAGVTIGASPWGGVCQRNSVPATGGVTYDPTTTTIYATAPNVFGSAGTVTIDGVAVTPTSYSDQGIVLPMTGLAADLANPWGWKSIIVTPSDTNLPAQSVGFYCGVSPTVTTTVNGGTDPVTVAAGTPYSLGYSTTGFIGQNPFSTPASGYEYVTNADYQSAGFRNNVAQGVPAAAGDYWVRVSLGQATYDRAPYYGFDASAVHVTITGLPLTVTPVSKNGSSFTYKGQLGDGTAGASLDFSYGVSPSAPSGADAITAVSYQYRDSACENAAPNLYWIDGLPKNVARSSTSCGGDGTTESKWDVRVKSVAMTSSGTDRSVYYATTFPTVRITITKRNVAVSKVRADKVYDGTNVAPLGELGFTGAVDGDDLGLDNAAAGGTFADVTPGTNKEVTLNAALSLSGGDRGNYVLTNPSPTVVGTISKASAVLSLASSSSSLLLSQTPTATITATSRDPRTNQPVDGTAAAISLTSQTPKTCTISGTTVTGVAAGTCTIAGSQPASVDYQAAKAASDETSTVETIDLQVFAAPRTISVVADDLTVGVGDDISPSYQVSGLFDGDSVDGVEFAYYSGTSLLDAAPTTPGTYRMVPTGGTLTAASDQAYTNPDHFGYVAGKLVITLPPPTIDGIAPLTGSTAGGTTVTITGTRLDTVKAVHVGSVTLKRGDFQVNADGTVLTFVTPKVTAAGGVSLELAAGAATAQDVFTYVAPNHPKPPAKHAPGSPHLLRVSGGDRSVTVTFSRPAKPGSSPVRTYEVSTDRGRTWHVVATKTAANGTLDAVVHGLDNGHRYSVRLRARNAAGAGVGAASSSVLVNASWLHQRTTSGGLVDVPARPKQYRGPVRRTVASYRDAHGRVAHPVSDIGHRQLLKGDSVTTLGDLVFHFDKATITAKGWRVLRKLAGHLSCAHALRIEGYTDYAGHAGHQLQLSQQRALAIAHALAKLGVKATVTTDGYGGRRPVVVGGSAAQRSANRRVLVDVVR